MFLFLFPNYLLGAGNEGAIFLIDYAKVKVKRDGKRTTLIHQKIKITGEKGRKFAELRIPFDSERQKVKLIKGITITSSGKTLKVSQKDIKIVTPAELTEYTALYPGIKTMSVSFPGVTTGSIIEYKYIVNTFKPLIKNHFWDGFYFQSTEPFSLSRYELQIPKNMKMKIKEKGVKLKEKKEKSGYKIYIWEKKNVPAIIEEILMPPLREFIPKVYVSTFHSWEEIGKWFFNLSKECATYNEEIEKLVEELSKGKSKKEKISSIYHHVCKKIRYVGLEMGIHGFKPHNATDVFRLKYGDCKDKANLMRTMLKIAGIKSYICLINTEGKIAEEIPFPGQFNHAIIAIPEEEGFMFLDPTSEVFSFPDLPPSDQNRYTLIASPNPLLAKTPLLPPERNSRKRIIHAKIDEEGKLQAKVEVIPEGIFEASMREGFRYLKEIERKRTLARELNRLIPGTSLISFEIRGLENLSEQLVENYEFSNDFFGIKVKDRIIFRP
ncbi:DUF3857 domain-containing protein, partial [bacterium]|nr:DUF3857 domain-containing protein [bacterium]